MQRYTAEQRVQIVKTFYQNNGSITVVQRKLRDIFGRNHVPSINTIRNLMKKFEESGLVVDQKNPVRTRRGRSAENIAAVSQSVLNNPGTSIRRRAKELNISTSSVQRILNQDICKQYVYKELMTEQLSPTDSTQRCVDWLLEIQCATDDDDKKSVQNKAGRMKKQEISEDSETLTAKKTKELEETAKDSAVNVEEQHSDSNHADSAEEEGEE